MLNFADYHASTLQTASICEKTHEKLLQTAFEAGQFSLTAVKWVFRCCSNTKISVWSIELEHYAPRKPVCFNCFKLLQMLFGAPARSCSKCSNNPVGVGAWSTKNLKLKL